MCTNRFSTLQNKSSSQSCWIRRVWPPAGRATPVSTYFEMVSVCFVSSTVTKIHRKLLCGVVRWSWGSTVPGCSADMCHSWWRQNRLKNKSRNDKCVVSLLFACHPNVPETVFGRRSEHKMHLTRSVNYAWRKNEILQLTRWWRISCLTLSEINQQRSDDESSPQSPSASF